LVDGAREGLTWTPGTPVKNYILVREIARGGMAEIWLARQAGMGFERVVAIKRIIASAAEEPAFVEMFLDEARIAYHLNHPNIVQVYEAGEHHGSYFIVMEYVPGQNLARVVRAVTKDGGAFPVALAVKLIALASDGLGYAHTRAGPDGQALEIVHRDVSPQNVIVTYDGHLKVLDFGIAKAANRLSRTKTGTVKGKLAYMAPEQALGQSIDARADVFALGVMLFELVTGTRLYGDQSEVDIFRGFATHQPVPSVRSRKPEVPDDLDALIARAMNPQAALRFADGRELHLALEAWLKTRSDAPSVADLEALMKSLFGDRIDELRLDLEAARSGRVLEEREPSSPTSPSKEMPGRTPDALGETRASRPPRQRTSTGAILIGAGGLLALGAAGGLFLRSRSVEPPAPPVQPFAAGVEQPAAKPEPTPPPPTFERAPPPPPQPEPVKESPPAAKAEPAKADPAKAKGKLTLNTTPWTRVYLGKTVLGDTPLIDVPVPAGKQVLKLVNDAEGVSSVIEVQIKPGQTTVKKLSF
jgi:serine/threonine-protein kinase